MATPARLPDDAPRVNCGVGGRPCLAAHAGGTVNGSDVADVIAERGNLETALPDLRDLTRRQPRCTLWAAAPIAMGQRRCSLLDLVPDAARVVAANQPAATVFAHDVLHSLNVKPSVTLSQGLSATLVSSPSGDDSMTGAISSFQSGAQIALKLLGSGAAPSRDQALGGVANPTTTTNAALDKAMHGTGTKIFLSAQTAINYFGAGSDLARAVAGLGDQVGVTTSGLDVPADKAAFRQQVLDFLKSDAAGYDARYPEHAEFLQALKDGKVIVKTVDESPELKWQPNVGWAIYKDGYPQGGGTTHKPVGDQALYDKMSVTLGQTTGQIASHMFYAYYEK